MKNFIFIVGLFVIIIGFGFGMNACKSKGSTKSATDEIVITGDNSQNLVDKKWKLFELNGVDLSTLDPQPAVEAFIIFQFDENRVNGNSGCNNFTGTYQLGAGNELSFSGMASTRKLCIDMTIENQMNQLFQVVDSYSLQDNILSLNLANTPLARFVVEE